jgi:lysophospholipase L1-like esterase
MNTSSKYPRWLANFSLLLGSTLFSLVVAEVAIRLTLGASIVLFPRYFAAADYDGVTLRRLIPNSTFWHTSIDGKWEFRTNAQGFRDDEDYKYEKPAGQRRILVLGDSHTQGYEVHQSATFAKVLERRLRQEGLDAQVLNTGISGFGTAEELMFLEHEGMKFHPDVVVLAFFENDFDDSVKSDLYTLKDGNLVVNKTRHTPGVEAIALMNSVPGAAWLSQNSYLFSLLVNNLWETAKKALSVATQERLITEYAIRISEVAKYERELVVALIERMKAVTGNVPLVIVEIPSFDPNGRIAWLPSIPEDLIPAISSVCDVYLPASSYLAGAEKGTVHVPHGHRHISEQTHARIAEVLDRVMSERNLLFGTMSVSRQAMPH